MKQQLTIGTIGTAIMLVSTGSAFSQSPASERDIRLEEIIITAEKRESTIQDTALSVTVISGESLANSGAATGDSFLGEVLKTIPGVTLTGTETGITIRGINSSNSTSNGGSIIANATYVDGVFVTSNIDGSPGNLDTERVEVLRGPQGTLYGRSSTGGVINIITNDPQPDFGAKGLVEFGSYNLRHYAATLNVPIGAQFAMRATYDKTDRDGYLDGQAGQGAQDDNHGEKARVKLKYTSDRFKVMLAGYQEWSGRGYGSLGTVNFVNGQPGQLGDVATAPSAFTNAWTVSKTLYGRIEADLGFATATLIPAWSEQLIQKSKAFVSAGPLIITTYDNYDSDGGGVAYKPHANKSNSGEFRLNSKADSKLIWVIGANRYKSHTSSTLNAVYPDGPPFFGGPVLIDYDASDDTAKGYFGQLTYPITDQLRLTAGARRSEEKVVQDKYGCNPPCLATSGVNGYPNEFSSNDYLGRIEYNLAKDHLLYGSIATGFLPGGLTLVLGSNGLPGLYKAENLKAYEVGSKNLFLDGRLMLNGDIYYYDYPERQLGGVDVVGGFPTASWIITNASKTTGGEIETAFQITNHDRVSLTASYVDAKLTSLSPEAALHSVETTTIAGTPKLQMSGGYQRDVPLPGGSNLNAQLQATYRGKTLVNQRGDIYTEPYRTQKAVTLLDLTLGYKSPSGKYGVNLYGRNLTNEIYMTTTTLNNGLDINGVPNAASGTAQISAPRTYGIVLNAQF